MSGTGTAAATAIILIGLAIGLMAAQPSLDNAIKDLQKAERESQDMSRSMSNSGISIAQASYNNTTSVLNLTIRNDGSAVMETEDIDILINGTMVSWDPDDIYLYPSRGLHVTLSNITDPRSLMVVERYGISDHLEPIPN